VLAKNKALPVPEVYMSMDMAVVPVYMKNFLQEKVVQTTRNTSAADDVLAAGLMRCLVPV
jgi:hypothetical protein